MYSFRDFLLNIKLILLCLCDKPKKNDIRKNPDVISFQNKYKTLKIV